MYLRCDPTDGSWWVIIANKGKRLIQTMNNKILYASVGPQGAMGEERPESFLLPRPIYPLPALKIFYAWELGSWDVEGSWYLIITT